MDASDGVTGRVEVLSGKGEGGVVDLAVDRDAWEVGTNRRAEVHLRDRGVSFAHARLLRREDGFYVQHLNARGGTFVNGEAVEKLRRLESGDELRFGQTRARFVAADAEPEVEEGALAEGLQAATKAFNRARIQAEVAKARQEAEREQASAVAEAREAWEQEQAEAAAAVRAEAEREKEEAVAAARRQAEAEHQEVVDQLRREVQELRRGLEEAESGERAPVEAGLDAELERLRGEIEGRDGRLATLEAEVARLEEEASARDARLAEAAEALEKARAELAEREQQLEEINEDMLSLAEEKDRLEAELKRGDGEG